MQLSTGDGTSPPWFDGHNDALLKLSRLGTADTVAGFADSECGELNLPTAKSAGFTGGFFAVFCPSEEAEDPGHYHPLLPEKALPLALEQTSILFQLEQANFVSICRTPEELRRTHQSERFAAILHFEGAEALGPDAELLQTFYGFGLRSLGLVWSRQNAFGTGVPMIANSSPDVGPGLTEKGKTLVHRCNKMGVLIDLSHLNEKGFWDVAGISRKPLVATHSNAHELCPHARNLTDQQLQAIADSGGVAGLTFAVDYLRPDGQRNTDTPLSCLVEHFEHMLGILGPDSLAIGSDFDGAYVPDALCKADRVPDLLQCLRDNGHDSELLQKVFCDNWLRIFAHTCVPETWRRSDTSYKKREGKFLRKTRGGIRPPIAVRRGASGFGPDQAVSPYRQTGLAKRPVQSSNAEPIARTTDASGLATDWGKARPTRLISAGTERPRDRNRHKARSPRIRRVQSRRGSQSKAWIGQSEHGDTGQLRSDVAFPSG